MVYKHYYFFYNSLESQALKTNFLFNSYKDNKMVFKINISDKGKAFKLETESEALIRIKIGDKIQGSSIDSSLEGYELQITGTSDEAGFPGIKGETGAHLRKVLLRKGDIANKNRSKGLRLRKSVRGEEIDEKTVQINMIVIKEGSKKFADLLAPKEEPKEEEKSEEAPAAEEKPAEEKAE
jgi:small subunit ribosomal protein S6e